MQICYNFWLMQYFAHRLKITRNNKLAWIFYLITEINTNSDGERIQY
jgi:hypothetical protein